MRIESERRGVPAGPSVDACARQHTAETGRKRTLPGLNSGGTLDRGHAAGR